MIVSVDSIIATAVGTTAVATTTASAAAVRKAQRNSLAEFKCNRLKMLVQVTVLTYNGSGLAVQRWLSAVIEAYSTAMAVVIAGS
jgi:seryl-tRNA synthetase